MREWERERYTTRNVCGVFAPHGPNGKTHEESLRSVSPRAKVLGF